MTPPRPGTPDVSVVVIVHNDERRLPTAVRSVLRQTLRALEVVIVDDASTDGTAEVAAELSRQDPRVRYLRLPENSGGCGRPRNTGARAARGRYVMFLDSDDRLERHACKNLLEALEDADADFSMGLVRRQYMDTGRQTLWHRRLFDERRVVGGLEETPELINDVLSVNKLFRVSFLRKHDIAFPEDVHYEDQLFTFMAYHRAERIAIIPENVYLWRIFRRRGVPSITQQRHRIENFHDRLRVHRRLDAYIADCGTPSLQRVKDLKFLQDDMRLYFADVIDGDGTVTAAVLQEAESYLRAIPVDRYEALPLSLRAAYGMALRHDTEGLRQVMLLDRRNILAPRVSRHDGTTYLSSTAAAPGPDPAFPLDAPENAFLVADGSPLLQAPAGSYHLCHELVSASARRGKVTLQVRTFDALGKVERAGDAWSLGLSADLRGTEPPTRISLPVRVESRTADEVVWSASIDGKDLVRLEASLVWDLQVETRFGERSTRTPLIWHPGTSTVPVGLPARGAAAFGQRAELRREAGGQTSVVIESQPGLRRKVVNRTRKKVLPALEERVTQRLNEAWDSRALPRVYAALRRLPIDPDLAVFEANMGTVFGDSPKYVFEELRRIRPSMKAVWALPEGHPPPAPGVQVVERGSLAYLRALSRAAYWVDNQTFPAYVRKRPGQRYLQTWHGIPLKKMGRDEPGGPLPKQRPDRGVGAWDELVVPNPYFEKTFVPAYEYRKGLVRYGTPRNDPLVDGRLSKKDARLLLDLPQDARVVLYAPTFRQSNRSRAVPVETPFDVGELLEGLADRDTFLLLRPHYLNQITVPAAHRYRAIDVSDVEDVNLLYLAADVLVTDYSSVMFDFALLRKPIVYFTYDYSEYLSSRGTYVDLIDIAPGPLVTNLKDLTEALRNAETDAARHAERYAQFLADYCGMEDGRASRRAVEALLDRKEERP